MGWKRRGLIVGLVCSLVFCNLVYAETNWQKFSYFQNWGGLNDQLSSTEIADNEASAIQNIVFDSGVSQRKGFVTVPRNPASTIISGDVAAVTGLAFFTPNDGNRYLVAVARVGNAAYVVAKTYTVGSSLPNTAWTDINNNTVVPSIGYTNNDLVSWTTGENVLVGALNATTQKKPFKWSGTGNIAVLTADADCPTGSIVCYHRNHLFISGNDTDTSRVFFSALDDITGYTATDFFDVETNDGSIVRGLVSAFNSLYIFKDYSIWRLSGAERDTFFLEKMVSGIGTLSHASIAIVNNLIYFTTAQNDTAIYDGGYTVKFISSKIRNTINGLNFARGKTNLGIAFSTYRYNDHDYYCSVTATAGSSNNRVLFFDTAYQAWSKFVGMNTNAWCVADDDNGKKALYFGDYSGYVHRYPSDYYYDGDITSPSISAFYQTKWFKYNDVSKGDKYFRVLKTYIPSENTTNTYLSIDCRSDYETVGKTVTTDISTSGILWGQFIWGESKWAGQSLIVDRQEVNKGTQMFQVYYSNNTVSKGFTILGFETFIEPSDRI